MNANRTALTRILGASIMLTLIGGVIQIPSVMMGEKALALILADAGVCGLANTLSHCRHQRDATVGGRVI